MNLLSNVATWVAFGFMGQLGVEKVWLARRRQIQQRYRD